MPVTSTSISVPAGFAPAYAIGFSDMTGQLALVSEAARLPVATAAPAPAPLAGQTSASEVAGPFEATPARVIVVTLDGQWQGTARLLRSTDGGLTKQPLRVGGLPWAEYSEPGTEQAWLETEEGASFYLDIALTSGSLAYRVSQ
uniref:hypothetical protein n=1 Tax=Altererythrobacter segetis TaxID=1104773 RepID=UPI00140AF4F5|nr:hypothetical protein [Altererythrobacter segetis]